MNQRRYIDKLTSWFGEIPFTILQSGEVPGALSPTMFFNVTSDSEMMHIRVYKRNGRLKVHLVESVTI